MSRPARDRPWVARVGFLIGVAAVAGLIWWTTRDLNLFVGFFALVSCVPSMYEVWSSCRRGKPALGWHSFRFSIWQVMAGSVLVAVYLGLLRALFIAYPIPDNGIVLMLSACGLFVYAMFCFLGYQVWVSVRNVRAVLRGERLRHPGHLRSTGDGPGDNQPRG